MEGRSGSRVRLCMLRGFAGLYVYLLVIGGLRQSCMQTDECTDQIALHAIDVWNSIQPRLRDALSSSRSLRLHALTSVHRRAARIIRSILLLLIPDSVI